MKCIYRARFYRRGKMLNFDEASDGYTLTCVYQTKKGVWKSSLGRVYEGNIFYSSEYEGKKKITSVVNPQEKEGETKVIFVMAKYNSESNIFSYPELLVFWMNISKNKRKPNLWINVLDESGLCPKSIEVGKLEDNGFYDKEHNFYCLK